MHTLQRSVFSRSQVVSMYFSMGEAEDSQMYPCLQIRGLQIQVLFGSTGEGLDSRNSAVERILFAYMT